MPPIGGTGPIKPFFKQKMTDKVDCPLKNPKVVTTPTIGETPLSTKLPPPPHHGIGKGLMTAKGPVVEQCPLPPRGLAICYRVTIVHHQG